MKRAVAMVLVMVCTTALADPAPDVPKAELVYTLSEREFELMTVRMARLDAEAKACKEEVKKAPILPVWATVLIGVAVFGAGVGVGVGVAKALPARP